MSQNKNTSMMKDSIESGGINMNIVKALENSPKGRLRYDTGWDNAPNAVTALIATVQESEIDGPNREILGRCYRVHHLKERLSLSPKTSPPSRNTKNHRSSLPAPGCVPNTRPEPPSGGHGVSPLLRNSFSDMKLESSDRSIRRSVISPNRTREEPRIEIHDVSYDWSSTKGSPPAYNLGNIRRRLLTPPTITYRKKSVDAGSPHLKPSPTLSSSTQTQTHSSTTSDATLTPVRNPTVGKHKKFGITDESLDDDKLEEDLLWESRMDPFRLIEDAMARFNKEDKDVNKNVAMKKRLESFNIGDKQIEKKVEEELESILNARKDREDALKRFFAELEKSALEEVKLSQSVRAQREQQRKQERKVAADSAEQQRARVIEKREAAKQEELQRIQKSIEEERNRQQAAVIENERLQQQVVVEQRAAEAAALQKKLDEEKKAQLQPQSDVIPELSGLILSADLKKYFETTQLLKAFEEPVAHIGGKDPATKAFYIGAVKCINTPLNALADTHEGDIMLKVQHFSKLLCGEQVSGGGSMNTLFTSQSLPNGDRFVMKTLAFRFVKKSEADVTRGKSTVQPLATVGVHLCKQFPVWASLVQAYMYRLCPFLVPFSYPQQDKTIQQYAQELGHELSGTETAIQQTFLERMKGYCTLYALMILKFHNEGSFDLGEATEFFTLGGAWQILVKTMKLEPQVDVTATVIHTLLEILDERLHLVYRNQFSKLMRLLVTNYVPRIRNITPPAKAGSLSRLQIYVESKFGVR